MTPGELRAPELWRIRFAIEQLPVRCRYHGDRLDGTNPYYSPEEACCDTGIGPRARREALAILHAPLLAPEYPGAATSTPAGVRATPTVPQPADPKGNTE